MIMIFNNKTKEFSIIIVDYVAYLFLEREGGEWLEFELSIILLYFHYMDFGVYIVGLFLIFFFFTR